VEECDLFILPMQNLSSNYQASILWVHIEERLVQEKSQKRVNANSYLLAPLYTRSSSGQARPRQFLSSLLLALLG